MKVSEVLIEVVRLVTLNKTAISIPATERGIMDGKEKGNVEAIEIALKTLIRTNLHGKIFTFQKVFLPQDSDGLENEVSICLDHDCDGVTVTITKKEEPFMVYHILHHV